jgi:HEAT repeat protein
MRHKLPSGRVACILLLCCLAPVDATDTGLVVADPVTELTNILRIPVDDPQDLRMRQTEFERIIPQLRSVQDLHAALNAPGWRDTDPDVQIARVDQAARDAVVGRLIGELRAAMARPATQLAAANIIAELGTSVRETSGTPDFGRSVMRRLSPDLRRLVDIGEPQVRAAAARALSSVDPPADVAAAALANLLSSPDVALRRSAAASMSDVIRRSQELLRDTGKTGTVVGTTRLAVLQQCAAIVPRAAPGLSDPDTTVRRDCAEAIRAAAYSLYDFLFVPTDPAVVRDRPIRPLDMGRGEDDAETVAMTTLARALSDQSPAVARILGDTDPAVRLVARRILENMADARRRMVGPTTGQPVPRRREQLPSPATTSLKPVNFEQDPNLPLGQTPGRTANEALRQGLTNTLEPLAAGVNDPDIDVRRATVGVLELIGSDSPLAVGALIQGTGDSDRFVRWVAGRALGRIRPMDPNAVPALARLLADPDLDVRQVAALAIERYGPGGRAAVPALAQAVAKGDPDARIAALHAIEAVGVDAVPTIPAVVRALSSSNARVRQAAARTLGRFGPSAISAEPALRQALLDPEADVRAAAGEALLSVLQPPREK